METISKVNQLKNAISSENLTENSLKEEWAISWLDSEKACFLIKAKINLGDSWLNIGDNCESPVFECHASKKRGQPQRSLDDFRKSRGTKSH